MRSPVIQGRLDGGEEQRSDPRDIVRPAKTLEGEGEAERLRRLDA